MSDETESPSCLDELVEKATEKSKEGEFLKLAKTKLLQLADAVKQEEDKYLDAYEGFSKEWEEQNKKVARIKCHLDDCFPDWKECLKESVCKDVIQYLWSLKEKIKAESGPAKICLDQANADFNLATNQLEAWKTISAWIKARLEYNKKLIDEICTLDNCEDRLFALYIFYFELLPSHKKLKYDPKSLELHETNPEKAYCEDCCQDCPDEPVISCCGFPWLIDPEQYNCKVARLYECWRDAGVAQVMAQCKFDQVAANQQEYDEKSSEVAKRDSARKALRKKDKCNPCAEDSETEAQDDCKEPETTD